MSLVNISPFVQFSTLGIDFLGAGPSQPEEAVKVCVCVCVCVSVCNYVCMYVCTVYTCVYVCICMQ